MDLRSRLAASVSYAARRLWRRSDLEAADIVILDLLYVLLMMLPRIFKNYYLNNVARLVAMIMAQNL